MLGKILQFLSIPLTLYCLCIHDKIIKDVKMIPIDDSDAHHERRLQQLGSGPIRFHYEYNQSDITENDALGKNVKKVMEVLETYWAKTIEVDYMPYLSFKIHSSFDSSNFKCLSFHVPQSLIDNPTPNKDFGFLIEAKDDGDSGVTAYSYPCAYSQNEDKPTWGMIHWNKQYMTFDPLSFQENIHIGIHQMLHVLGFSQLLYPKFKNSNVFINSGGASYLNGTFIREEVKRQYGCANPIGMPLETGGGQGTALSHWSRKTAFNQLMTAGVSVNNPTISYITLALLEQTGWYRKIYKRTARFINFGFRKGCGMLQPGNCSSNQYCHVQDAKMPDYDVTSLGYCKNDSLSLCMYVKYYINFICTDPNYVEKSLHASQGVIGYTGETGGEKARCFESDLRLAGNPRTKYGFRCYEAMCSWNGQTLTIRVGNTYAFCLFPNQEVQVKGYDGTLRCPKEFSRVCKVRRCPEQCNGNGICLDGRCLCSQNYTGQLCQKLSSKGFSSQAPLYLLSHNNNCMVGSYRNVFGFCRSCTVRGCARCTASECLVCLNGSLPVAGIRCL